jgi:gliding motility-associated-like protein
VSKGFFEEIDTHKNMNRIIRNITTMLVGMAVWTLMPQNTHGQCKVDNGVSAIAGEFSINGTKVQVKGAGGGSLTATNNIPIKICEGELITLKNTLPITALTLSNYWIMEESVYKSSTAPRPAPSTADVSFTTLGSNVSVKLTAKTSDPSGLSFYNGPGRYVILQYDNSTTVANGAELHHSCQVIEVIAPPRPVATVSTCSGGEFQVTIPVNANNIFDDYKVVFTPLSGTEETEFTGKKTLPFSLKKTLSGNPTNSNVIINISGETITGGCPSPPANSLGSYAPSTASLFKPSIISIAGTTTKAEFNIELAPQNGTLWKFYRRDITSSVNYDNYTTEVLSQSSLVSSGTEFVKVVVPDADKMYCYQVASVDAVCGTKEISSEEICTTPANAKAENNQNVITWLKANGGSPGGVSPSPFVNYEVDLLRADGSVDQILLATPDRNILTFTHNSLTCGQEYTYRVRTLYSNKSYSQIMKVRAISNDVPSKIPRFFATMTNDNKNVSVQGQFNVSGTPLNIEPNGYKYYRSNSLTGAYSLQNTGNQVFKDLTTDANKQQYCYYMTWTNTCAKESDPSDKVCTVFLKTSGATVNWSKENAHSYNTDSYIVRKVNPSDGTTLKDLASNLQSIYSYNTSPLPETEGQEIYIQIESRPTGWNIIGSITLPTTLSNIIKIFRPSVAMSPQIFTPNNDNVNDKFIVRGKFIQRLKMTIYDRWGNPIYSEEMNGYPTENNQNETTVIGWDGIMNNGNKASEGSYAYKIEITDTIGQMTVKEGALLLAY